MLNWSHFLRILPWYLAAEWVARRRKPPASQRIAQLVVPIRPEVQVAAPPRRSIVRSIWHGVRLGVELMGWLSILVGLLAYLAR